MNQMQHHAIQSVEDYLETILTLHQKSGQVRSIDIANERNYSKASVSVAMKNLRQKGYITMAEDGYITLTESGKERAESVLERHTLISNWLISIGVDKETALKDACKIEHDLSPETFDALRNYLSQEKN